MMIILKVKTKNHKLKKDYYLLKNLDLRSFNRNIVF